MAMILSVSGMKMASVVRHVAFVTALVLLPLHSSSCAHTPGTTNDSDTRGPSTSSGISAANAGSYSVGSYLDSRASGIITSPRVMFIGDSLLGGLYASKESATWSAHVISTLKSEVGDIEVVPAPRKDLPPGTPTSTSSFDLSRIPDDLGLAVVELGTNDSGGTVSLGLFAKQYSLILDRIRSTSPNSYILCLSPWPPSSPYTTIIVSACTTRPRTSYVDISKFFDAPGMRGPAGQTTPFGLSDDFHPNDAGHRAIADSVNQALW